MGEAKRRKLAGTYPDLAAKRSFFDRYATDVGTLDMNDAIGHARREKSAAYAFVPMREGNAIIGGTVWVIAYDRDHETEPDEYDEISVYFVRSIFGSGEAEDEWYSLGDSRGELEKLRFRPTRLEPYQITFLDLAVALRMLEGESRDAALAAAGYQD